MGLGEGIGSAGQERALPGPPGPVSPMTGTRVPPPARLCAHSAPRAAAGCLWLNASRRCHVTSP